MGAMHAPVVACESSFVSASGPPTALRDFCTRWGVDELRLTGSALVGPFRADSDVDFVFFASYRSPIYAPEGWARPAAAAELSLLFGGRRVDLVCARQTVMSRNPYAVHNFLVKPSFPRALGLLFYFEQVSSLLASSGDLSQALRGSQRGILLRVLLTFASVVETEDRVAMLRERGLDGPWEEAQAALTPCLRAVRGCTRPAWPDDATLVAIAQAIAARHARVAAVVGELSPPPAPPTDVVRRALGDLAPGRPTPSAPSLHLGAHPRDRARLRALCKKWQVHRLIERIDDTDAEPSTMTTPARAVAFASVRSALYASPGVVHPRANGDFADAGLILECARSVVATANPGLVYNAFVRVSFTEEQVRAWFRREAARGLVDATQRDDAAVASQALKRAIAANTVTREEAARVLAAGCASWAQEAARLAGAVGDGAVDVVDALHIRLPTALVSEAVGDMPASDRWRWHPA